MLLVRGDALLCTSELYVDNGYMSAGGAVAVAVAGAIPSLILSGSINTPLLDCLRRVNS